MSLLILLLVTHVYAICNCSKYVSCSKDGFCVSRRLAGCDDNELLHECKRAEWEMSDFVTGVMNQFQALVAGHPSMDVKTDSDMLSELALALEKYRPVPDCSTGLFTTTPAKILTDRTVEEGKWDEYYDDDDAIAEDFCVSLEILKECESAEKSINSYIKKVVSHIQSSKVSLSYKMLIENRLQDSVLPTISCKTTKHTFDKIESSASTINLNMILLGLAALY